jgi:hypothetical protein
MTASRRGIGISMPFSRKERNTAPETVLPEWHLYYDAGGAAGETKSAQAGGKQLPHPVGLHQAIRRIASTISAGSIRTE